MADELTREFLIESMECLDRMERCLTELEQRPNDAALLAEIFRSVHTIKGTTGFLGFKRLEKLAHAGENLLGLLRDGKLAASAPVITGLLQLLDGLRAILKTIEANDNEGQNADTDLISQLESLQVFEPVAEPVIVAAVGSRPKLQRKKSPRLRSAQSASACAARLPSMALGSTNPGPVPITALPSPTSSASKPAPEDAPDANRSRPSSSGAAESTIRVDIALLNRMMNLVGELVLTRNQVLQATASDPALTLLSRRLDMVTADLRESVMKARMQPVSNVFSKMPRLVRDLSQALHRRVRLEMEGQETELDKSLLEAIKDPLTHAVRNALDHGIESPDIREASGKDPEGTLKLRAMQEGSHVIIEICDDGAGISAERIRVKAIERGLISAERAMQLPDRELLQLIFVPGFSTASRVTNISGRGVGMDVVRTNVEKIGGKVELDSRVGKGTVLRLRIPLTLAIIPALIVRSVGQSFALPQGALSELIHVPCDKASTAIEWIDRSPLYRLRGRLLPLVFLDRLLVPGTERTASSDCDRFIAVLDAEGRRFGLVVDGLADPEEIVVKPLNAALKGVGLYSGATVLGSGDLALILDLGSIAQRAEIGLTADSETDITPENLASAESAKATEYLLVDISGHRAAIPLAEVIRIEQLSASRIEYIGRRPVLNFEGHVLAIEDCGDLLAAAKADSSAQLIVVVCNRADRHVGIAVSHVLDVAAGADLLEAGANQRTEGATLLKDRVVGIVDIGKVMPSPSMNFTTIDGKRFAEAVQ